jgi:hypothetical protein
MKWLLLSLLSINLILFIVHYKEQKQIPSVFHKLPSVNDIQLLAESSLEASVSAERCLVLSGFDSDEALAQLILFLQERKLDFEQVVLSEEKAPVFWVYVNHEGNAKEVKASLKELGIDSYEILDGELRGMLSAGLFENIDLARSLVDRLKSKGVNADFFERKKIKKTVSVEINLSQIEDRNGLIQGLQERQINSAEIKEFFCKSIASEK